MNAGNCDFDFENQPTKIISLHGLRGPRAREFDPCVRGELPTLPVDDARQGQAAKREAEGGDGLNLGGGELEIPVEIDMSELD